MTQYRFIFQITTPEKRFQTSLNRETDCLDAAWKEIQILYPGAEICLIRKYRNNA